MAEKSTDPILASTSKSLEEDNSRLDIAALAYELWHQRGCPEGSPEDDWYEAERRLQSHKERLARTAP